MLMQREQDAHGDEGIAVVVGRVVGGERRLDARFQKLTELDHTNRCRPARLAGRRGRVAHAARLEDRALLRRCQQRMHELQIGAEKARRLELHDRARA